MLHKISLPLLPILMLLSLLSLAGCPADTPCRMVRDIPYRVLPGVDSHSVSLDIYTPETPPADPMPVVIWVHGGGWCIGDKENFMALKPALFTGEGYCLVSINYRLSPNPPSEDPGRVMYPIHEEDVTAAIAWVYQHIGEYSGNPDKIAILGHSAGAHLVSIVSTDESFLAAYGLPLGIIKGTVSLDTEGYDVAATMNSGVLNNMYTNAFGEDPLVWEAASPINHIAPGKGIPPFLLARRGNGARQALCNRFADTLKESGIPTTIVDASEYSHAEVNRRIGLPGEEIITPPLMNFLKACFEAP